jgi:uncharacterized protein YndB with AHSA1/START domain
VDQTTERVSIERTIEIEASPETVWEFLTDPEKAKRWWGIDAIFDTRPGGEFRLHVASGSIVGGEYLEVEPPRRLVYTFGWIKGGDSTGLTPPGSTTVELTLEPSETGTTLSLVHRDLANLESAGNHGAGWDHYLARLVVIAAGGDPGPDPWAQQS